VVPAAVGLVLLALAALYLRGRGGNATPTQHGRATPTPQRNPTLPREYAAVARTLGDDLNVDLNAASPSTGLTAAIDQLRRAEVDLRVPGCRDSELAQLAAEAHSAVAELVAHFERVAAIPTTPGVAEFFAESFFRGLVFDVPGVFRRIHEIGDGDATRTEEARAIMAAIRRAEAFRLALPAIAARHAGPPVAGRPVLGLDFDSAWGPIGPSDRLELTNNSGISLHRCTVEVELIGPGGRSARAVHYVEAWRAGAALHARYSPGQAFLGIEVSRRTPTQVEEVVVSIGSDELSQERVRFAYAGDRRDEDVARYCRDLRVEPTYRTRARDLFGTNQRRLVLVLRGVAGLEQPRVTATFRRGGEERAWTWNFTRWHEGESKVLDTGGDLPWDPDEFDVAIRFHDTGYVHRGSWTVR
jgi:hypothetical protein